MKENQKLRYKKNEYFSLNSKPIFEVYKRETSHRDWLIPYNMVHFNVKNEYRPITNWKESKLSWLKGYKLHLADMLPIRAPYVPRLLVYLINNVENHLIKSTVGISNYASPINFDHPSCDRLKQLLLYPNLDTVEVLIEEIPINWVINMIKLFLFSLYRKPLIISRCHLRRILMTPLSDKYKRPNISVRDIISEACMRLNRSSSDTLAFMMIHIIHFWKYDYTPTPAKLQLAEIFGPLLISFDNQDLTTDDQTKSPHSALLEIMLEVCDYQFWYKLTHHSISGIFKHMMEAETLHHTASSEAGYKYCNMEYLSPLDYFTDDILS